MDYFLALQAHQVPTELHLYHHGPHGMALADETTAYDERHQDSRIADWIANALAFYANYNEAYFPLVKKMDLYSSKAQKLLFYTLNIKL